MAASRRGCIVTTVFTVNPSATSRPSLTVKGAPGATLTKLGVKNWLFIGHPDAGDRAAVIYSLVVSCQRHGHNPHDYLRDVLGCLPAMTTADDLQPLLPSQWRPPVAAAS